MALVGLYILTSIQEEYRPQEKRDKTDYTEMTAMSALANCAPRVLCNEDIYRLDMNKLTQLIGDTPITVLHASIQCDEFSLSKGSKAVRKSLEDMSSTMDMFIPTLNMINAIKPPIVVVENVPGFMGTEANPSAIYDVFKLQLRRQGYNVHDGIFDARDYGGYTSRRRMYMVATSLDAPFEMPKPLTEQERAGLHVWNDIILPNWEEIAGANKADITELKVTKDALATGWARVISKDKPYAPTLMKAQGQDTKDAVMIERDGRYYRVPVSVQAKLNALPESFDTDWMPKDKAAQIIGQSICCKLHHAIMNSVKRHLEHFKTSYTPGTQMALSL